MLGWTPGAQVPGGDGQRVLLALAWLPILGACWISQVVLLAAGHLVFSHFIRLPARASVVAVQLYVFTLGDPTLQEDSLPTRGFTLCGLLNLHLGNRGGPRLPRGGGKLETLLPLLEQQTSLLIAGPDGPSQPLLSVMGEINRVFSVFLLQREREIDLGVWDDFN